MYTFLLPRGGTFAGGDSLWSSPRLPLPYHSWVSRVQSICTLSQLNKRKISEISCVSTMFASALAMFSASATLRMPSVLSPSVNPPLLLFLGVHPLLCFLSYVRALAFHHLESLSNSSTGWTWSVICSCARRFLPWRLTANHTRCRNRGLVVVTLRKALWSICITFKERNIRREKRREGPTFPPTRSRRRKPGISASHWRSIVVICLDCS